MLEKICTLNELETIWSLDDVMRMHALLDMRFEIAESYKTTVGKNI